MSADNFRETKRGPAASGAGVAFLLRANPNTRTPTPPVPDDDRLRDNTREEGVHINQRVGSEKKNNSKCRPRLQVQPLLRIIYYNSTVQQNLGHVLSLGF